MAKSFLFVPLLAALLAACGGSSPTSADRDGVICSASMSPGIVLKMIDSLTGDPVTANAVVRVKDGAYTEELRGFAAAQYAGAWERPGIYDVTVQVAGYQEWKFVGLMVGHDECHVKTIRFSVELTQMTVGP